MFNQEDTLLDLFLSVARNPDTVEDPVLECGSERWTYGDLDAISTGLAVQLNEQYGLRPTVAVISENHPYVLAILLAIWKLDGIFAPMDHHAPMNMIQKMLEIAEATCVVAPEGNKELTNLLQAMNQRTMFFPQDTTVISLTQRYLDLDATTFPLAVATPCSSSQAAYIHTSSASSVFNLKHVQLTHGAISNGAQLTADHFSKAWPSISFIKPKVLGFSPWSHVMALSHDIGAGMFGLGGCMIMGIQPSGYPYDDLDDDKSAPKSIFGKAHHEMDVLDQLLETALRSQPEIFAAVPWVLEGLEERYRRLLELKMEDEANRVKCMLRNFKSFGVGGAAMAKSLLSWAAELNINLSRNIGMTEFGGPIFHTRIDHSRDDNEGWPMEDCLVRGAELTLVNDAGEKDEHEGELVVRSKYISHGYLKYDNSPFTQHTDGTISFRTGDIYALQENGRYVWKGRRDDYIQMASSETLDPRPIEKALNLCSGVAHCCVVGNNFISRPSHVVCVIIQPSSPKLTTKEMAEITQTVSSINRTLPPPLRIAWSRVGILDDGVEIPYTRKGTIFRKKLEEHFGDFLDRLLHKTSGGQVNGVLKHEEMNGPPKAIDNKSRLSYSRSQGKNENASRPNGTFESKGWNTQEVEMNIKKIVADVLELEIDVLRRSPDVSFSEFGMDSNMAVRIVNELNTQFGLHFPLNACHDFIDIQKLSEATLIALGIKEGYSLTTAKKRTTSFEEEKDDVVIVGQAVRLPGDINTPESFWDALIAKRDDIMIPIPADRWDHPSFYRSPTSTAPPKICDINFEKSGFVDVAHFDNNFFGISTPEALNISPSTRLTLETVFDALEDACIPISKLKGTNTGVFVAASLDEGYNQILYGEKGFDVYTRFYGTGVAASAICGRISYLLDVHGPSSVTDTACSSGLVVLDQAVKFIRSGEGESAIVTAVNTNLWPGSFGFLSAQKMASPNSRCATFTNEADGYVPSEGSVSFILKSRSAAIRDGNNILAVIRATDVMHGGKTQGLVAPNVKTQISLQSSLLSKAGLEPSDIDFLETHGTGTQLGDLIEIQGINTVFQNSHSRNPLILGAAKSCIGHTEVAAGLVGLLKAIGTLQNAAVPGLVHLTMDNMNPSIDCGIVPISIPINTAPLPLKEGGQHNLYHGLVLANGFAGTFAGVIIEESPDTPPQDEIITRGEKRVLMPFVVSAKTAKALEDYLVKYLRFLQDAKDCDVRDICYTSCIGREHYRYRFACVVSDMEGLISCIQERLHSFAHKNFASGVTNRVAFAFPGQGSQYQGMASALAERYSNFKEILLSAGSTAAQQSGFPILSFLVDKTSPSHITIDDSQISQICIFVYQYSVSLWLKNLGIEPSAVLGHSLGEIAASVLAGAMSFDVALSFVIKRAELLRSNPTQPGGMAIIAASKDIILQLIFKLGLNGRVVIAVYNDPESHVISGELSAVETLLSNAKSMGLRGGKLSVTQGFHSPLIYPSLPALQKWLSGNQGSLAPLNMPIFSTVLGSEIPSYSRLTADYWVEHARNPVKLCDAVTALSSNKEIDVILDVGPQPFIWAATQSMSIQKCSIALSAKRTHDQVQAFLSAIATLFENGVNPNFERLFPKCFGQKVHLPTYPYQRQRHYPNAVPSRNTNGMCSILPQIKQVNRVVVFNVNQALYELLVDHQIEGQRVAPGASFVDFFATTSDSRSVKSITLHSPLVIESPHLEVNGEIDASGKFFLKAGLGNNHICSGVLSSRPIAAPQMHKDEGPPEFVQSQTDVYERIKAVYLGPSFRNIQNIRSWPTHADVLITVKSTRHPTLDRIRKIDCCLHALGGLIHREVPQVLDLNGSFLPTSLDDFTLHCEDLPESFICRYRLPFDVARNYHVASVSFDVFSLSGDPLISCRKYSVAWIPVGVAVQNSRTKNHERPSKSRQWLRQVWTPQEISPTTQFNDETYENLLHISPYVPNSPLLPLLRGSNLAAKTFSFFLPDVLNTGVLDSTNAQMESTIQSLKGTRTIIVLDLTSIDARPVTESYLHLYRPVLQFMKLLSRRKLDIFNFVIISEMSIPAQIDDSLLTDEPQVPTMGALVQGMLRVFRREMGLDSQLWALDLPCLDKMEDPVLCKILVQEINNRGRKSHGLNRTVAYRHRRDGALERLIPVLQEAVSADVTPKLRGPTVIVGMGSIGKALVEPLITNGSSHVIFIGRRLCQTPEVSDIITRLNLQTEDRVSYLQADVCDLESLRKCFGEIQIRYGNIESVIHSAAVISDAILWNIDNKVFENVLRPKVIGAWNLHLITEELCPSLKSFVLLSSISVSLGNEGQMAYVAANSYMEVLSSYRLARKLPATAIQLGPWESKLTEYMNVSNRLVSIMSNKIGIPLILKAIAHRDAVQVIADFDTDNLAITPAFSQDPLFQTLLPSHSPQISENQSFTEGEISDILEKILRTVLELKSSENLDLNESLITCGIDSIAFAQIRGRAMKEFEVEVPMRFLSDSLTIREMIAYVINARHTLNNLEN